MVDGILLGVFGTDQPQKEKFESDVAKKSEAEGISVFHRADGTRRASFLDTTDFPQRIQGYSRIASLVDHAFLFFPPSGSLAAPDGELAVLLGSLALPGTLLLTGGAVPSSSQSALRGTAAAQYPPELREPGSSMLDLSGVTPRADFGQAGTFVYIDRAFSVKGVGTVALGFVLSGRVSVHDRLRAVPGPSAASVEVRGVQVSDVDYDSAGRGVRVGLLLKGVEPKDLEKSYWLDDGTFDLSTELALDFVKSPFYKAPLEDRDLHIQLPGALVPARVSYSGDRLVARLQLPVPRWPGMRAVVVDLNGKNLRVAGGGACKF